MAPESQTEDNKVNLEEVLTIANKAFNVKLNSKHISWSYKKKQHFSEKEKKTWTCSEFCF